MERASSPQCQQGDASPPMTERIGSTKFYLLKLKVPAFVPNTTFSKAEFPLQAIKNDLGFSVFLRASRIFNLPKELEMQHIEEFLSPQKGWNCPANLERFTVRHLARHLFTYICKDVCVEERYEVFMKEEGIKCKAIGMGTPYTLHGTPDMRVRGEHVGNETGEHAGNETDVVVCSEEEGDVNPALNNEQIVDDSGSDGTGIECKRKFNLKGNLSQVVATCVTAAFTQRTRHKVSAVPVILISPEKFQVIIYDCVSDLLLTTDEIPLVENNTLIPSSIYLLYVVVNHR